MTRTKPLPLPCGRSWQRWLAQQSSFLGCWRIRLSSCGCQDSHAELAALEAAARQAASKRCRHSWPSRAAPHLPGRFINSVEVLRDGTELHLASFLLADAKLHLEGSPAFSVLKAEYADLL